MQVDFPTLIDKETQGHGLQNHLLYLYNKKDNFNRHMRLKILLTTVR